MMGIETMTGIELVLIIAVVVELILIVILWGKVNGADGGDCCGDVRRWAPKVDQHHKDLHEYHKKVQDAICDIVANLKAGTPQSVNQPEFCDGAGPYPPSPMCDFGTC